MLVDCVSQGSYNVLFIVAVVVTLFLMVGSIFVWDRFGRSQVRRLTPKEAEDAKIASIASLIISVISLIVLLILFFGYQQKIKSWFEHAPSVGYGEDYNIGVTMDIT